MSLTLNNGIPVVRLRAFRAIDEPHTCELFVSGHEHVLKSIGVTKVTSSKNEWINNPGAFVLIVESLDRDRVYGGARVHVAGGSEPLPMEQATGFLDPFVYNLIFNYSRYGTGELCGLWNSREIAGYGIGAIFLIRAAVAIANQIGLQSLFALCAPYTIKLVANCGMELEKSIGNNGEFIYPKLDLIATAMVLKDVTLISKANIEDKEAIISLIENKNTIRIESLRNKQIEIHYETELQNSNCWKLEDFISNAYLNFNKK